MGIIYSHISGKHLDTDACEVVELNNGDVIAMDDDDAFWDAFEQELLSRDEMLQYGFTEEDLNEWAANN
jgi:hypothetical protein